MFVIKVLTLKVVECILENIKWLKNKFLEIQENEELLLSMIKLRIC